MHSKHSCKVPFGHSIKVLGTRGVILLPKETSFEISYKKRSKRQIQLMG